MTQEERNLLVKELSSRLPYLTYVEWNDGYALLTPDRLVAMISNNFGNDWKRPFLRPMSSMTEDEEKDFRRKCFNNINWYLEKGKIWHPKTSGLCMAFDTMAIDIDWLNAHYFDYRGLIPMGLAIEAPEGMYDENC